jgi:hypothetical protein
MYALIGIFVVSDIQIVTCLGVRVTKITGSCSDDWIYYLTPFLQVLVMTLKYRAIADLYNFQFIVAHALGFSVSPIRLLATDLNTNYRFRSLRSLRAISSSITLEPRN